MLRMQRSAAVTSTVSCAGPGFPSFAADAANGMTRMASAQQYLTHCYLPTVSIKYDNRNTPTGSIMNAIAPQFLKIVSNSRPALPISPSNQPTTAKPMPMPRLQTKTVANTSANAIALTITRPSPLGITAGFARSKTSSRSSITPDSASYTCLRHRPLAVGVAQHARQADPQTARRLRLPLAAPQGTARQRECVRAHGSLSSSFDRATEPIIMSSTTAAVVMSPILTINLQSGWA